MHDCKDRWSIGAPKGLHCYHMRDHGGTEDGSLSVSVWVGLGTKRVGGGGNFHVDHTVIGAPQSAWRSRRKGVSSRRLRSKKQKPN